MVRLDQMNETERRYLEKTPCPTFHTHPWVEGPPVSKRRVSIVSTAGLHARGDRPFTFEPGDYYRIIPGTIEANNLVMTHISTNFDHTGFQQDWNIIFPIDRLKELAGEGMIGSVADFHYSFMGAHDPMAMEQEARLIAGLLRKDDVEAIILLPV
jgi:D-proline reductase (dithiol) PrdB